MLVILDEDDKLHNPDDYDRVVKAEIPCKEEQPAYIKYCIKHMIHGPCGVQNPRSPCMKNGRCKKGYPKPFSLETYQGNDSYPVYKRYDTNNPVPLNDHCRIMVDNTWVVPYNPCIKSVKYLYKYVYKGPDRVSMEVRLCPNYDEVQQYIDARWVCAPEACWKIFSFPMYRMYPAVFRLQIHLPDRQQESMIFFVDGPGELGKTFLYRTILATLRKEGVTLQLPQTSGIAATLPSWEEQIAFRV
ncbi:uncharacterized protein LOC142635880 [Castanea sativa]|uniref:uncharacterized protein LOC142635880 n=1 Tax=Castanea sativa TaxID=21020 RepID=UPI003F64CD1C